MPRSLRGFLTEWLRALWEFSLSEVVIAPLLENAILSSGARQIIDLCSGSSGPLIRIQNELGIRGLEIPALLTDKFPDREALSALAAASHGRVSACMESVDAAAVPENLTGLRTLFNSFHHFRPAEAREILRSAYRDRQPIGIFEITARRYPELALCFPASFLSCFLLIWRMRPLRPTWWILTWIVPVIPLMVGWDALISHLRSYTAEELVQLTDQLTDETWRWQQGTLKAPRGGVTITYLIGAPFVPPAPRPQ